MDFTVPLIQFLSLIILFKILAFFSEDRDSVVALGTSGFIIFFKLLPLIINSVNNFSLALSLIVLTELEPNSETSKTSQNSEFVYK